MAADVVDPSGQEPTEAPGAQEDVEGQAPEADVKFDAATVKQLRAEAAKFRTERNELEKRLKALEAEKQKREKAEMSELERLKAEKDEALQAVEQANRVSRERLLKSSVIAEAVKAGFAEAEDAWRLVNVADLDLNEAGEVTGAEKAIKALVKAKPYLLKSSPAGAGNVNATDGRGKVDGNDQKTKIEELRQRFRI